MALLTLVGLVALFVVYQSFQLSVQKRRAKMLEAKYTQLLKAASSKSSVVQRAVIKGQVAEQLAPILPGFPFVPSDYRAVGGEPIDFIVYVGLTGAKDGQGGIKEIVFGDIKTGNAKLSPHQRMIKQAVEQGRVRWQTLHIDGDFRVQKP